MNEDNVLYYVLKEKIKNLNLKLNNNKKCVLIFDLINNEFKNKLKNNWFYRGVFKNSINHANASYL
jgi:hypothetical protein